MQRVAINGFGRIGRRIFRIISDRLKNGNDKIIVVAINDVELDINTALYLLKYDSIYGIYDSDINIINNKFVINNHIINFYSQHDLLSLPWDKHDIDVVIESTGVFASVKSSIAHIKAGAKRVIITAPISDVRDGITICYGINHNKLSKINNIISTGSCTTNCIAPIAMVLQDNFNIEKAFVTTIHAYTNDQKILDSAHKDMRRARAAGLSMIPTSTGAVTAISLILPKLKGKFDGMAIRVPVPSVSLIDLVVSIKENIKLDDIILLIKAASMSSLKGILGYNNEPLVSVDFVKRSESSIVDGLSMKVINNNFIKILAWYDNEWGFSNRVVDLLYYISKYK